MSSNDTHPDPYTAIQPDDDIAIDAAIDSIVEERSIERIEEDNRAIAAFVRELITEAERALTGESEHDIHALLQTAQYYLRHDDRTEGLLSRGDDRLDSETRYTFKRHIRLRNQGKNPPPKSEFTTIVKVCKALDYFQAWHDTSRYAPVTMQKLDMKGAKSSVEGKPSPVGRRRIGRDQSISLEDAEVVIPHEDCEHILVIALPRQGKDSTIVNICGNLKDEHPYKWFSCFDDGRNETPMVAIPNDEAAIKENLDAFDTSPKGYDSAVYVPDTSGVPDYLPSNFKRFTIGIDDLNSELVLRLAGVTSADTNTVRRIGQALRETQEGTASVENLVSQLREYAEELEATITVTSYEDDELEETEEGVEMVADAEDVEDSQGEVREVRYEMDADELLRDCADALMMLAGEGLIADAGAETNIDLREEFTRDRVAVLNCNFLKDRNEALRYVVLNLWLRFIFRIRDEYPRLPRAVLEIRELKNVCPSKLGDTKYKQEIKALRNTIYEIATQGGSRRIMMVGSTQKLNEVYKAVRTNMPIKILLQLNDEEILTLDRSHNFSYRQKEQLRDFDTGMGMILGLEDPYWPIQWRGARCGLGLGDENWRDRYGSTWGARVRREYGSDWHRDLDAEDTDYWISVRDRRVQPFDPSAGDEPDPGDWFLLPGDLDVDPDDLRVNDLLDEATVEAALADRRDGVIPSDLSLSRAQRQTQRTLSFQDREQAQGNRTRDLLRQHDIPPVLKEWIGMDTDRRESFMDVLHHVKTVSPVTKQEEMAGAAGTHESTVNRWLGRSEYLGQCIENQNGEYVLTNVGRRAVEVNWEALDRKAMAE